MLCLGLALAPTLSFAADAASGQGVGREAGWLRVVGGVHYPTDIYAGRTLGQELAREFLDSVEFQRRWTEVKAEVTGSVPH